MSPRVRVLLVVSLLLSLVLACAEVWDASKESQEVIIYTTLRPPNQDIYLVNGPDTEPRRMTEHLGLDYNATFSPDGRWLVFTSDRGGWADEALLSDDPQPFGDLWAVPVEGGALVRLTDNKWEDGLAQWGMQ